MKKIYIGLLTGAIMLALGMLVGQVFQMLDPSLKAEYENPALFRAWTDPIMSLYFIVPFISGIIMAWLWSITKGVIPGSTVAHQGIYFGLAYWLISFPGMIMSYSSFYLSPIMVISWTVSGLVESLVAGYLLSKLLK